MRGFPKHLNTREDYEYVAERYPVEARTQYQALLNNRKTWLPVGSLKTGEKGVESKNLRMVEMCDELGKTVDRVQEEYKDDPNALIARLGFTVKEVERAVL